MEPNREDRWIFDRLAALEPQWRPDFAHGRELLDAGLAKKAHSWRWAAATATVGLCLAALAFPQTRAFAQQVWYRLVLKRVDVVRLDLSKLPLQVKVIGAGETEVNNLDEAERRAGFRPYLPPDATLRSQPRLTITGPTTIEGTVRTKDLEAALRKAGADDVEAPKEWEGAQLRAAVGSVVTADYADDVRVQQMRTIELSIPAGFPLERFAEIAFRSLGASMWESRALARKFASNPSWFLDIPPKEVVHIQEVPLRAGSALVIEDRDNEGRVWMPWTVTVVRSAGERMYAVSANDRQLALRIIQSLP
jgi:hypothetical protein